MKTRKIGTKKNKRTRKKKGGGHYYYCPTTEQSSWNEDIPCDVDLREVDYDGQLEGEHHGGRRPPAKKRKLRSEFTPQKIHEKIRDPSKFGGHGPGRGPSEERPGEMRTTSTHFKLARGFEVQCISNEGAA